MTWWGWGAPGHDAALPEHALRFLAAEVGLAEQARGPVDLAAVRLRESALPAGVLQRLLAICGADGARTDREARVWHAAGKSYPDLVRQRTGDCAVAPDVVALPRGDEQVRAVLECCAAAELAVVPFGGGTSVVGGVEPLRGRFRAVVTLDLGRMDRVIEVDPKALVVGVEPGLRLPALEVALAGHGLTLGHFPQSYEFATVGGCAATRSAGQASTGYGRFEELVRGVRLAAPAGELDARAVPATAAGPDLRALVVGSEGTLGVITGLSLSVRPRPPLTRHEGFVLPDFGSGVEALRALAQERAGPDVVRLSDEQETRASLALAGEGGWLRRVGFAYVRARGRAAGALLICGWEGEENEAIGRRARSVAVLRRHDALSLGQAAGAAWVRTRFHGPYLRDALLARGVLVDTLETATSWSRLEALYDAVGVALRGALDRRGTPPLVLCHVSHVYESGASLYFTFLARQEEGAELEQWRAAKCAASEAIMANGGTITHHHAVGTDHLPWMEAEVGSLGLDLIRAAKQTLDPVGVMNPGKLLP